MKKLLWISACVPYDDVPHAGGKIENFYIKEMAASGEFDIYLLAFAHPEEIEKIDLQDYKIEYSAIPYETNYIKKAFWALLKRIRQLYPLDKYGGLMYPFNEYKIKTHVRKLKKNGYVPDIIVLEWTEMVLNIDYLRKMFPDVPIVSVEVDVSFLGYERKYKRESSTFSRWIKKQHYVKLKEKEEECLRKSSLVILNNNKDLRLIEKDGISDNVWTWVPFFQNYHYLTYAGSKSKDILFYGAMNRRENWESALWFIDNVLPSLEGIRLIIVGNNPPSKLKERESANVHITGFVENVEPYFENSLCMVAPLVLGAGIKIKVLEAMSAGIPVLTNNIGIEGIDALNGRDFLLCETSNDYITAVKALENGTIDPRLVSFNCKQFMADKYDMKKSAQELKKRLVQLESL